MSPQVSILMITYRRPQFIAQAVESIRRQTFTDWELIVVDDSQDDAVASCFRAWVTDPRIRYFHRGGGSYANALNCARDHARAALLAILDDDDYWTEPAKLEMQVAFMREHPEVGVCGSAVIKVDAHGHESARISFPVEDRDIRSCLLGANCIFPSTAVFRKEVGAFDEAVMGADWELWLRAGQHYRFHNLPAFLCAYRWWSNNGSKSHRAERHAETTRLILRYRSSYPHVWRALLVNSLIYRTPGYLRRFVYQRLPYVRVALRRLLFPYKRQGLGE